MAKQLDADLKKLLTKQEAQEALTAMQTSAAEFAETGWEPEREVFFRLQRADREYAEIALTMTLTETNEQQLSNTVQAAKKKIHLCAWISITAVILCAALCALAVLWSR